MRRPSDNPITLPFGATTDPYSVASPHKGTDFGWIDSAGGQNLTIMAPFAGKVSQVPNNGNDGNGTYMTDPQGRFHGMLHASSYSVPNGSSVSEGQQIAVMGETGAAEGVHCHWAVKENGAFIDPMSIIDNEGNGMAEAIGLEDVKKLSYGMTGEAAESNQNYLNNVGLPFSSAIDNFLNYPTSVDFRLRAQGYHDLEAQIADLTKQVADLQAELDAKPDPTPTPPDTGGEPDSVTVTKDNLWTSFLKFLGLK